ncbi:hypothetical protein LSUE1_G005807 [Lachnellula suecica]|uniref:Aminoglycoside phosphotransferase domain-containing protein n=1 Tax=Lachnellula suecica TaxID=602035 RepID=A0A8T9C5Q5_9HELO|nr:hypothetical protein LSUE1_G005807 [Lachnellula suecica]
MKLPNLNFKRPGKSSQPPTVAGSPTSATPSDRHTFNDTKCNRKCALALAWPFKGSRPPQRDVIMCRHLSPVVLKYGTDIQLSEATTLRYLAKNTSIPVPKVYAAFQIGVVRYILMEFVNGKPLQLALPTAPPDVRDKWAAQIKSFFTELRAIPHPRPGAICSVDGGPLFDRRFEVGLQSFGPFANEKDFNEYLQCGVHPDQRGRFNDYAESYFEADAKAEIQEMEGIFKEVGHKTCFTHADANTGNFIVKGNKVVAMIDFEMAGFYPEYWDYVTAMMAAEDQEPLWKPEIGKFLQEYPKELKGMKLRLTHFGIIGYRSMYYSPWFND